MTIVLRHHQDRCDFCGVCVAVCPTDAIDLAEARLTVLDERCTRCGQCVQACPVRALEVPDAR
ncbi:MAG TPA: 4Fe-4S binding protein [bacterium]|nr:4Fe-4S binding protein [bacterium]